jgi:hypothetical protein
MHSVMLLWLNAALTHGTRLAGPEARAIQCHRCPMAWLTQPQAEPAGTWTRQGQRCIGDAAGGAKKRLTGSGRLLPRSGAADRYTVYSSWGHLAFSKHSRLRLAITFLTVAKTVLRSIWWLSWYVVFFSSEW